MTVISLARAAAASAAMLPLLAGTTLAAAPYSPKHDLDRPNAKQAGAPPQVPGSALPDKRSAAIARERDRIQDLDALLKSLNATTDLRKRAALALAYLESAHLLPPKDKQAALLRLEAGLRPLAP